MWWLHDSTLHNYHISGCQLFIVQASAVTWQLQSARAQVAPLAPGIQAPPHFINPGQPPAASYHGSTSSRAAAAALSGRGARRLLRSPAPRHTRSYGSFVLVTAGRQGIRCCSVFSLAALLVAAIENQFWFIVNDNTEMARWFHIISFIFWLIQIIGLIDKEFVFGVRFLSWAFLYWGGGYYQKQSK